MNDTGVVSDEQDRQPWPVFARKIGHLTSVKPARQPDISNKNIYILHLPQTVKRGRTVVGFDNRKSQLVQPMRCKGADLSLVLNQQDYRTMASSILVKRSLLLTGRSG